MGNTDLTPIPAATPPSIPSSGGSSETPKPPDQSYLEKFKWVLDWAKPVVFGIAGLLLGFFANAVREYAAEKSHKKWEAVLAPLEQRMKDSLSKGDTLEALYYERFRNHLASTDDELSKSLKKSEKAVEDVVQKIERQLEQSTAQVQAILRHETQADLYAQRIRSLHTDSEKLLPLVEKFRQGTADLAKALTSDPTFIDKLANEAGLSALPVGTIVAWPGKVTSPVWHVCDGSLIPDKTGRLKDVLQGTDFPESDREGFVLLPNLQGYFLRGLDLSGAVEKEIRKIGHVQVDTFAKHRHHVHLEGGEHEHSTTIRVAKAGQGGDTDSDPNGAQDHNVPISLTGGKHVHDGDTADAGTTETRPKNVAIHWIIKVE